MLLLAALIAMAGLNTASDSPLRASNLSLQQLGTAAQPNVVSDTHHNAFILSWQARLADGCSALRVAEMSVDGQLGQEHEVARGCDWFVNWADFPSLVIADNGDWITHWLRKTGSAPYAYEIRLSRSTDRGLTWSKPIVPHTDGTPTEHGFVSMAPLADDKVLLLWLDGRRSAAGSEQVSDEYALADAMSLRSVVIDRAGHLSEHRELDPQVCSCCGTDVLRTTHGAHVALYRDRSDEEIRDISMLRRSNSQWTGQRELNTDNWRIAACPVNGPSLASNGEQTVAIWPTMGGGEHISVRARTLGSDAAFVELEREEAVLGRVDSGALGDDWLFSWVGAGESGQAAIRVALSNSQLTSMQRLDVAQVARNRNVGMPRLATLGERAVLVWTEIDPTDRHPDGRAKTHIAGVLISR